MMEMRVMFKPFRNVDGLANAHLAIGALIACLSATAMASDAGPRQFHNIVYPLPPAEYQNEKRDVERNRPKRAWYRSTDESHVRLTAPSNMSVRLYLLPGEPLKGDIKTWTHERLKRFSDELNAGETKSKQTSVLKTEEQQAKVHARDSAMVVQYLQRGDRQQASVVRFGVGITVQSGDGPRGEMVIFECAPDEKSKPYTEYFPTFLGELRFVSEGVRPLLDQPQPGPLKGYFLGMKNTYGVNGLELTKEFWHFSEDGRFYRGMPKGRTLAPLDWDEVLRARPDRCGNYRVNGDRLELEYADGDKASIRYAPHKAKDGPPTINGISLSEIAPPPDGTPLEGSWSAQSYTSFTPGSGVVGGVASSRLYSFKKDGTATFGAFVGVSASFENASGDRTGGMTGKKDTPPQTGKYRIEKGLLILTAPDGTETRKSILIDGTMLLIDGGHYLGSKK